MLSPFTQHKCRTMPPYRQGNSLFRLQHLSSAVNIEDSGTMQMLYRPQHYSDISQSWLKPHHFELFRGEKRESTRYCDGLSLILFAGVSKIKLRLASYTQVKISQFEPFDWSIIAKLSYCEAVRKMWAMIAQTWRVSYQVLHSAPVLWIAEIPQYPREIMKLYRSHLIFLQRCIVMHIANLKQ